MDCMNWSIAFAIAALSVSPVNATLIANWAQDELFGPIVDSTANHPDGIPTGSPTYGLLGVPNGSYGAIVVSDAAATAIEYGPTTVDEFFVVDTDTVVGARGGRDVVKRPIASCVTSKRSSNSVRPPDSQIKTHRFDCVLGE
jgi:hypothetical protein